MANKTLSQLASEAEHLIDWLRAALVTSVSESTPACAAKTMCGHRAWDNKDCLCAQVARTYLPEDMRD